MATVADLLPQIYARVEEVPPGVFWTANEANFAAIEALNDLLLLVGRPTQIVSVPFSIVPNTVWQTMPAGMFALTDIQGQASAAYKITLQDLDYLQAYGGSDWEQDIGAQIQQWAPIGLTKFVVHPAVSSPQTVLLTGIALPCQEVWPYTASTITVPFEDQFFQALEKYASHYLRWKESGDEFTGSYKVYQGYLDDAKRMTELEDRRDSWLFNIGTGVKTVSNPTTLR